VDRHDPGLFFLLGTRARSNFINSGSSRPRMVFVRRRNRIPSRFINSGSSRPRRTLLIVDRHDPGLFFLLGTRARSNFINSGSSRPRMVFVRRRNRIPSRFINSGSSRPRRTLLIVDRHDPGLFFLLGTRGRSNFINSGSSRPRLAPSEDTRG